MVKFKSSKIIFNSKKGTKQTKTEKLEFSSKVFSAEVVLKGFHIEYTKKDNRIWQQQIDLDLIEIEDNSVVVNADLLIRDRSGNVDDYYSGWVEYVVIANL